MYCPNCGKKIRDLDQKYCAQCGTDLSANINNYISTSKGAKEKPQSFKKEIKQFCRTSELFDINRNFYVFKEDSLYYANGFILDEKGQIIGKIERTVTESGNIIKLGELNAKKSTIIYATSQNTHVIKDSDGNQVASIKKRTGNQDNPKFFLEDPNDTIWFEAQGDYLGRSYKIINVNTGKIVAEIQRADTWEEIILGEPHEYRETYALKIFDSETDRCVLLGFVLSIDNALHDLHITRDIDSHTTGSENLKKSN